MADVPDKLLVISTSEEGWFARLVDAYKTKVPVEIIDDANVGIDLAQDSLARIGKKGRVSQREWLGILASFGVAGIGVSVLLLAFLDPEPTTKLSLLVGGGLAMTCCGGFSALHVITGLRPPTVRYNSKGGFDVSWNAEPASDPAS
jgi:hypothetical protein